MILNRFSILLLGVMLPFTVELEMNIVAGDLIALPCPEDSKNPQMNVYWKYRNKIIIKYASGRVFKDNMSEKYHFGNAENRNFTLILPDVKEGQYTCEVGKSQVTYNLMVWEIKGPRRPYFFQGENLTLILKRDPDDTKHTKVEWFSPQKDKVTGNEPRWQLQNNNWHLHLENLTVEKDHGTWECHIPSLNLKVLYNLKVLGFDKPMADVFAIINSNVTLSCSLNINQPKFLGNSLYREWMKDNKTLGKQNISANDITSSFVKKITKVQFEAAGKYQCRYKFGNKQLDKFIQLVVIKVSPEPSSEDGNEVLCCHISPPAFPEKELCWVHVKKTICASDLPDNRFCHTTTLGGLWRCDLKVKDDVKISINYTVEKERATVHHAFPLLEVVSGAGVTLLLLIIAGMIVSACKMIKQKRHQVKRMAQAKQHLLAKRTCQCQR